MPERLIGKTIGAYEIEAIISPSRWGTVYRAVQHSVNRTVALKALSPAMDQVPGQSEHFLEMMRATARIIHEHVVAIYEAGQAEGVHFCAMEYLDGPPLAEFLRQNGAVDEHRLLQTIAAVAHVFDFLWQRGVSHQPPEAKNVLTDHTGMVKVINVLPLDNPPSRSPQEDVLALGLILAHLVNEISPVSKRVSELVERMIGATNREPFGSLAELAQAAEDLDHELFPPPAPPPPALAKILPKKTKPIVIAAGVVMLAMAIAGIVAWRVWSVKQPVGPPIIPRPADFGTMVEIPAGEFIFQTGEKKTLPAFWIDRYEVTIGQYRKFLEAIASGVKVPEHPFVGKHKDHTPANWDKMLEAIQVGGVFSVEDHDYWLTLDSPVFGVDWFDAYAYAAWRGKRLPTDEEWEKAGRGTDGRAYPWGNELHDPHPRLSTQVYANAHDKSPFGVIGMSGGVSEWTGTATRETAAVRGGSWRDGEARITRRFSRVARENRSDVMGFRCAADKEVQP